MQNKMYTQETGSEWPANGLEPVENCPVCGVDDRELEHEGLADRVYFCAPGKWVLYHCRSCNSRYLDPRPTLETIGLAYQNYLTHDEALEASPVSLAGKLRRRFANGYRNYHFGTRYDPASFLGVLAASLMPSVSAIIDADMRHLPKATTGQRLLDLGCGNGSFLLRARNAGWVVVGIDFDPKAVDVARSKGLDVRLGGVDVLEPSSEKFDVVTLSHVIEHVHHPVKVLQSCYELLKPGGFLWIETPNITSEGYRQFGPNWFHLDPPRHLVLFTLESLRSTLSKVGFFSLKVMPHRPLCVDSFVASKAISEGINPYSDLHRSDLTTMVKRAERIAGQQPARREYITLKAWK